MDVVVVRRNGSPGLTDETASVGLSSDAAAHDEYAELRDGLERAVARICPLWLVDRSDDLIQVALIRVMQLRRKSEGERQFSSSYLMRTAHSALVDEIRRLRRRQEVPLESESGGQELVAELLNPEESFRGHEIGEGIADCLGRLSRPRRLAVTLYLQGHTVPQGARLLGWTVKRAENLVYRGLDQLRRCLLAKGLEP